MARAHATLSDPLADQQRRPLKAAGEPVPYLLLTALLVALLMSALAAANWLLAPLSYSAAAQARAADALAAGDNYAVFDLNLDTRGLRRAHIARLARRPHVVVLGASHWQEAHADLLPGRRFYNAHVHRDYHEDLLAVVEMLLRHDRLPDTLIMSIRDMTFLPEAQRSDTLWLTALPDCQRHEGKARHRPPVARDPPARALARPALALDPAGQRAAPAGRRHAARTGRGALPADHGRAAGRRLDPLVERASRPVHGRAHRRRGRARPSRSGKAAPCRSTRRQWPQSIACWRCCTNAACGSS